MAKLFFDQLMEYLGVPSGDENQPIQADSPLDVSFGNIETKPVDPVDYGYGLLDTAGQHARASARVAGEIPYFVSTVGNLIGQAQSDTRTRSLTGEDTSPATFGERWERAAAANPDFIPTPQEVDQLLPEFTPTSSYFSDYSATNRPVEEMAMWYAPVPPVVQGAKMLGRGAEMAAKPFREGGRFNPKRVEGELMSRGELVPSNDPVVNVAREGLDEIRVMLDAPAEGLPAPQPRLPQPPMEGPPTYLAEDGFTWTRLGNGEYEGPMGDRAANYEQLLEIYDDLPVANAADAPAPTAQAQPIPESTLGIYEGPDVTYFETTDGRWWSPDIMDGYLGSVDQALTRADMLEKYGTDFGIGSPQVRTQADRDGAIWYERSDGSMYQPDFNETSPNYDDLTQLLSERGGSFPQPQAPQSQGGASTSLSDTERSFSLAEYAGEPSSITNDRLRNQMRENALADPGVSTFSGDVENLSNDQLLSVLGLPSFQLPADIRSELIDIVYPNGMPLRSTDGDMRFDLETNMTMGEFNLSPMGTNLGAPDQSFPSTELPASVRGAVRDEFGAEIKPKSEFGATSTLETKLVDLKQNKGTAAQFLAELKNSPEVRASEMRDSGLWDYLEGKGKQKVTKNEMLDVVLEGNKKKRLETVTLGNASGIGGRISEQQMGEEIDRILDHAIDNIDADVEYMDDPDYVDSMFSDMKSELESGEYTDLDQVTTKIRNHIGDFDLNKVMQRAFDDGLVDRNTAATADLFEAILDDGGSLDDVEKYIDNVLEEIGATRTTRIEDVLLEIAQERYDNSPFYTLEVRDPDGNLIGRGTGNDEMGWADPEGYDYNSKEELQDAIVTNWTESGDAFDWAREEYDYQVQQGMIDSDGSIDEGDTMYSEWVLDGADMSTYEETLITQPEMEFDPSFSLPHFNQANTVAHLRTTERQSEIGDVLLVEELQSDLHQRGRKYGYIDAGVTKDDVVATIKEATEAARKKYWEDLPDAKKVEHELRHSNLPHDDLATAMQRVMEREAEEANRIEGTNRTTDVQRASAEFARDQTINRLVNSGVGFNGIALSKTDYGKLPEARLTERERAFIKEVKDNFMPKFDEYIVQEGAKQRTMFAPAYAHEAEGIAGDRHYMSPKDAAFGENDEWQNLGLKRAIQMAVEKNLDGIAWTTPADQAEHYSNTYIKGYTQEYDVNLPNLAKKLGKQYGLKPQKKKVNINGEDKIKWTFPFNDEFKKDVKADKLKYYGKTEMQNEMLQYV